MTSRRGLLKCYITIAPHNPNGPVCAAASMHLATSMPNFLTMGEGNEALCWMRRHGDAF